MPNVRKNVIGNRYGRVVVLNDAEDGKRRHRRVFCRCDCGVEKVLSLDGLTKGTIVSCGCRMREIASIYRKTHGKRNTTEFNIWIGIKQRCTNSNNRMYPRYGGRGIKICDRWVNSFEDFLKDMGCRPSLSHSIDRIDNDGDYSPENCRWAIHVTQANNTSTNHMIEHNGETKSIADWARETGIPANRIQSRISRGWNFLDILNEPYVTPKRRAEKRNATLSVDERYRLSNHSKIAWSDPEKKKARIEKNAATRRARKPHPDTCDH